MVRTTLGAAAFLSITVVVLVGGCDHPHSTPEVAPAASNEVSQISPAFVGKQITIHGRFSSRLKYPAGVVLDNHQVVYLDPRASSSEGPYSEMDGKLVAATGILRFYHAPPAQPTKAYPDPSKAYPEARAFDHFYFEAGSAQLRLIRP